MKSSKKQSKPQASGHSLHPVVGLRWVDKYDGAEYEISKVTVDNISYGHTPGQGVISGGAHCPQAWAERVRRGQYIVQPNHSHHAEPRFGGDSVDGVVGRPESKEE